MKKILGKFACWIGLHVEVDPTIWDVDQYGTPGYYCPRCGRGVGL